MNLRPRRTQEPADPGEAALTEQPDPQPEPEAPVDPHTAAADRLTAEAAALRADTAEAQREADQALTELRADTARRIADAERAAHTARQAVLVADRRAQELEGTAGLHRHALTVAVQISDTEAQRANLEGEAAELREQAAGFDQRLAQLALSRQATQANVEQAIDDGDAEHLARLRGELAGSNEITAALQNKLAAIRQRLAAIGEPDPKGIGALSDTVRRLDALRADQERVLDALDPARPGAEQRAFVSRLAQLSAYAAAHPQEPKTTKAHTTLTARGDGTFKADVRRT